MAASQPIRPITLAEYEALPDDDFYRYEVVDGWLVREPVPAPLHGLVTMRLGVLLTQHVDRTKAGVVLTEVGFVLKEKPLRLRGPDVAFVAAERMPSSPYGTGFWHFAPDLAVEVLSPSNRAGEIRLKVRHYLEAGSRAVWVVDPDACTVTVHDAQHSVVMTGSATLDATPVLPGLHISLPELFRR